jgi:hypothetical protein
VIVATNERHPFALPTCKTEEQAVARCVVLSEIAGKLRNAGQLEFAIQFLEKAAERDGKALDDVVSAVDRLCSGHVIRTGQLEGGTTFKEFAQHPRPRPAGHLHHHRPRQRAQRDVGDGPHRPRDQRDARSLPTGR